MIKKIKKADPYLVLKSAVGSTLAILIASRLNLLYTISAGIITLLTIQRTKKETLEIALKRVAGFIVAVILAYLIFTTFGFTTYAFGGFVFSFVALSNMWSIEVGVIINTVLVTHFLVEQRMDWALVLNEVQLLFIGMTIGILINLIMPRNKEKIQAEQKIVEDRIRETLSCLANMLKNRQDEDYVKAQQEWIDLLGLDEVIDDLLAKAYREAGNTLLSETRYQISYLEMRKVQVGILKDIRESIEEIQGQLPQAMKLARFIERASLEFTEENNVENLLIELDELYAFFQDERLPMDRKEFENRAILFNISKDFKKFLEAKRTFVEGY